MADIESDYDIFQELSNGEKFWQCYVRDFMTASDTVAKLGRVTKNEVFAFCIATQQVVVRANATK
jgi:hypothetical protein